jgi:hypothetical protein
MDSIGSTNNQQTGAAPTINKLEQHQKNLKSVYLFMLIHYPNPIEQY